MAFSGLVKDYDRAGPSTVGYGLRLIAFTLAAATAGWAFTVYMPQIDDMAWRFTLGLAIAFLLAILTINVAETRPKRMFGAVLFSAAFVVGLWGLWIEAVFGDIPTIAQLRGHFANTSYSLTTFGEPFQISGYIFELWAGLTVFFAGIPLVTSIAKPRPDGMPANPFNVHPDFADPFMTRLLGLPILSFAIAAGAVYGFPYMTAYEVPLQVVWLPPLVAAFFYTKMRMGFIKAMVVSTVGGIAGAAGFWLPWYYMTFGQDAAIAFVQSAPQEIWAEVQTLADGYGYTSTIYGTTTDYTPWTLEIWVGLTLAYLLLPVMVTLFRRFASLARMM